MSPRDFYRLRATVLRRGIFDFDGDLFAMTVDHLPDLALTVDGLLDPNDRETEPWRPVVRRLVVLRSAAVLRFERPLVELLCEGRFLFCRLCQQEVLTVSRPLRRRIQAADQSRRPAGSGPNAFLLEVICTPSSLLLSVAGCRLPVNLLRGQMVARKEP